MWDERNNFRESDRLKGLMDSTNRRFKVVFAGLHNVLRTTRQANHPLAHLGDPIRIGAMLSNGEWKQAQALVREPLQAVGCRFARDDLSTRILAYTNYYPSLIQLYGAELVSRLREFEKTFPYEIEDHDIDDAYTGRELRDAIRERFPAHAATRPALRSDCVRVGLRAQGGDRPPPRAGTRQDFRGGEVLVGRWIPPGGQRVQHVAPGDGGTRRAAGYRT